MCYEEQIKYNINRKKIYIYIYIYIPHANRSDIIYIYKHTVADIFHPKKQKQYQTYLHVGYEL